MKFFSMVLRVCRQGPGKPTFKGCFFKVNSAAFELGREMGWKAGLSQCACLNGLRQERCVVSGGLSPRGAKRGHQCPVTSPSIWAHPTSPCGARLGEVTGDPGPHYDIREGECVRHSLVWG